jgi:hypothetical protein
MYWALPPSFIHFHFHRFIWFPNSFLFSSQWLTRTGTLWSASRRGSATPSVPGEAVAALAPAPLTLQRLTTSYYFAMPSRRSMSMTTTWASTHQTQSTESTPWGLGLVHHHRRLQQRGVVQELNVVFRELDPHRNPWITRTYMVVLLRRLLASPPSSLAGIEQWCLEL